MGRRRVVHWVSPVLWCVLVVCIPWLCGQTSGSARVVKHSGEVARDPHRDLQPTIPALPSEMSLSNQVFISNTSRYQINPTARRHGLGAAWGDYDNDGYPDLYIVDVAVR